MFSAFDLTDNYFMNLKGYITMQINQETKLNLGRKLELYSNSIIELVLDDNIFSFSIISEYDENYYHNNTLINGTKNDFEYYGKTIINKIFLEKEKNNILYLFYNKDIINEIKNPNLLIKYRITNAIQLNYFKLMDGNIKYNEEKNTISIQPIEENIIKETNHKTTVIYNKKIFNYTNNINYFSNNVLNNEKPYKVIKYINPTMDSLSKIKIDEFPNGLFYLNILAEARKGNIYEYFTYNPIKILKAPNDTIVNITINKYEGNHEGSFSRSFIYIAKINKKDKDKD